MSASVLVEVEEDDDADCCFEVPAAVMAMDDSEDSPGEGGRRADEEQQREQRAGLVAIQQVHGLVGCQMVGYFGGLVALDVLQHGGKAGQAAGGEEGVGGREDKVLAGCGDLD